MKQLNVEVVAVVIIAGTTGVAHTLALTLIEVIERRDTNIREGIGIVAVAHPKEGLIITARITTGEIDSIKY